MASPTWSPKYGKSYPWRFYSHAEPCCGEFSQHVFHDKLYGIYYRFLETEDEYFDYALAKVRPQRTSADLRQRLARTNFGESA